MIVVVGVSHQGKVDRVPGRFHVVTQFFTLFFLPILAIRSVLVREDAPATLPIALPVRVRSVLLTWGRYLFLLTGVLAIFISIVSWSRPEVPVIPLMTYGCLGIGLAVGLLAITPRASLERAAQLALRAGIPSEAIAADFGGRWPDQATLDRLKKEIEAPEPSLNPRARFLTSLVLLALGGWIVRTVGVSLLRNGLTESNLLPALMLGLGLVLFVGGLGLLADWGFTVGNRIRGGLVVLTLVLIPCVPALSRWYWKPIEQEAWQDYLEMVNRDLKAGTSFVAIAQFKDYGRFSYDSSGSLRGSVPHEVRRPEYWLLQSLGASSYTSTDDQLRRLAESSGDPRLAAVLRLRQQFNGLSFDARDALKAERYKTYLPLLQRGEWPEELK